MLRDVSMSNDDALSDVDEPATPLPWKMLATLELHNTQDNVTACIDGIHNTLNKKHKLYLFDSDNTCATTRYDGCSLARRSHPETLYSTGILL